MNADAEKELEAVAAAAIEVTEEINNFINNRAFAGLNAVNFSEGQQLQLYGMVVSNLVRHYLYALEDSPVAQAAFASIIALDCKTAVNKESN